MKVCIIPGNTETNAIVNKLAMSLREKDHIVSIGQSTIDKNFRGSDDNDLTNLIELDYENRKVLGNYNSDVFIYLESNWNSIKSVSRIIRSIEYNLISPKKILLYNSDNWNSFLNMLKSTYVEVEQKAITDNIKTLDSLELESLQLQ